MITQKIIARTDSLKLDKIISRYGEDSMRQVVFIVVRPEPDSEELIPITIPEDAVGSFRILKPSGNFVIVPMNKSVLSTGETAFDVVLPASANTAKGSGYYDIRITSDTDKYYFTAQGEFIIDDNIISDEVLEDVSEVNGLIFPDDFFTVEDHVAYIDDDTVSTDSTWSSNKINEEIEAHAGGDVSKTVSGNPVTFTDGAAAPLVNCIITISPKQAGSGVPSPDNIRTISGYSSVAVNVVGKNLVEDTISQANINASGVIETGGSSANFNMQIAKVKQGVIYVITSDEGRLVCGFYTAKPIVGSTSYNGQRIVENTMTFTAPIDGYVAFRSSKNETQPQLEIGDTASEYVPYNPNSRTYTISLGDTYYSGHIDAVRGVLVADKAKYVYDGSNDEPWYASSTFIGSMYIPSNDMTFKKLQSPFITNQAEYIERDESYSFGKCKNDSNASSYSFSVWLINTASVSDFRTYLAQNPLECLFELSTPIEIPLTPTVISSLLGNNTMWTDGDSMEVEYITQRFQPLIDSIKQL